MTITVIQVYAPTCNAEEAEVERFYQAGKPDPHAWNQEEAKYLWYTEQDGDETVLYANFHGKDPNREKVEISGNALGAIADFSNGDARSALSSLEMVVLNGEAGEDGIRDANV